MTLSDVMGCAGAVGLLLAASAFIPVVGPMFGLLTPLPFLYYASKLGPRQGTGIVAATIAVAGLIAAIAGYGHIIFFLLEFGLLGLVLSEIFRRRLTFGLTIFCGTACMLLISILFLFFVSLYKETGPMDFIFLALRNNLTETLRGYEGMGLEQGQIEQLREYAQVLSDIISRIYPALLVTGTGFVIWMNVIISKPLFRFGNLRYPEFGPQDRWRAPDHLVWGFIGSGFALFLPFEAVRLLAVNSLIVISVIYAFQGLAIALFYMNKHHVPAWLRWIFYLMIVFQQLFLLILFLAGLFDQWVDFRRVSRRASADSER